MQKNTREKIMDAAKELFSENGFAAVSTKEIAKKANTSEVTLFRHFDSKRNLFNAIVKEGFKSSDLTDFIKNQVTYDVRDDLTKIAKKMFDDLKQNSELIKMTIKDAILNSDAEKYRVKKESSKKIALKEYFAEIKKRGLIKDDPQKLMKFFVSNIHGFAMHNYILRQDKENFKKEEYFNWLISKIIDTILM